MASLQIISILCLFVCGAWLVSGQDEGCGSPLMEKYKSRLRLTYNYNVGCQELQEPRCKKYGYRETTEVNFLNHNSQFEARGQMSTFDHLIFSNCSAELEFFLCTFHFPICVADLDPVQPCRSMCHRVRDSCAPVLRAQGYEWPEAMSCELLPEQSTVCNGKAEACVNEVGPFNPEGSDIIPAVHLGGQQPIQEDQTEQTPTEQPSTTDNQVTPNSESQAPSLEECAASCQRYGVAQAQPKGTVWGKHSKPIVSQLVLLLCSYYDSYSAKATVMRYLEYVGFSSTTKLLRMLKDAHGKLACGLSTRECLAGSCNGLLSITH